MSEEEKAADAPREEEKEEAPPAQEGTGEEESTAVFAPVVELEEVEVETGEEDEEVVLNMRAKCFIYGETLLDQGTGNKTWKERGVGDVRILRHRVHQRLRLLMRQDRTKKVIANHAIDPRIQLEKNVGSDRSWIWTAHDFSDGELIETHFAMRFANTDVANDFKEQFEGFQREMEAILAGEDQPDEDGVAEEAAAALKELTTGGDDDEEGKTED